MGGSHKDMMASGTKDDGKNKRFPNPFSSQADLGDLSQKLRNPEILQRGDRPGQDTDQPSARSGDIPMHRIPYKSIALARKEQMDIAKGLDKDDDGDAPWEHYPLTPTEKRAQEARAEKERMLRQGNSTQGSAQFTRERSRPRKGGVTSSTEASTRRSQFRSHHGEVMGGGVVGGAAKFYEEVPVSAKDFQVYALLDRARLLRERHQRLAGADAQHAMESNELEPGNLVDGTTRQRRRRPRTGGSEATSEQDESEADDQSRMSSPSERSRMSSRGSRGGRRGMMGSRSAGNLGSRGLDDDMSRGGDSRGYSRGEDDGGALDYMEEDSKGVAWAEDMAGAGPHDKPTWKNR